MWQPVIRSHAKVVLESPGPTYLSINKVDLAPHVGADLSVMDRDSKRMRGDLPYLFTNLKTGQGLDQVCTWVEQLLPQHVHRP